MNTITLPSGLRFKFGRKESPEVPGLRRLCFSDYVRKALPVPPVTCDYTGKAAAGLAQMDMNDSLGDCVIAGGFHVRNVTSANAGAPVLFSSANCIQDYSAIGHYVPGDPSTDQGANLQDALKFWSATGFPDGVKLTGWLALDPTNQEEVEQAIELFENVYLGISLPDKWVNPQPGGSGFVWDVAGAPNSMNGHCIMAGGYNSSGATVDTWGMLGTLTWKALAYYCDKAQGGEIYTMLSPDMIDKAKNKAPNGLDWATLIADFQTWPNGGNVPVPPIPAPPVPPTTGLTFSLAGNETKGTYLLFGPYDPVYGAMFRSITFDQDFPGGQHTAT